MPIQFDDFKKHNLILASKSPRRQFLLKNLGLDIEIKLKEVDETFPLSLKQEEIPLYLCEKKANAFDEELSDNTIVIAADTIVWINRQALNKPANYDEAVDMLTILSGKIHQVYTGICLKKKHTTKSFFVKTNVHFKKLSKDQIHHYITNCKPYDKAGAYGAQECLPFGMNPCSQEEIKFLTDMGKIDLIKSSIQTHNEHPIIDKINGSYFNVMGLPLVELYKQLIQI